MEPSSINNAVGKAKVDSTVTSKHKVNRERQPAVVEEPETESAAHDKRKRNSDPLNKPENASDLVSPHSRSLAVNLENPASFPGTPASNVSNHSSGDSFSSTSSTRLLLRPQSHDTLPE